MLSLLKRYAFAACLAVYAFWLIALHATGRFPRAGLYDLSRLTGVSSVQVEGVVIENPVTRWQRTRFLFSGCARPLESFCGRAAVTLNFPWPDLSPGDRLRLRGWPSAPRAPKAAGDFDERHYLEGYRTFTVMKVWSPESAERVKPAEGWQIGLQAWRFQERFRRFWQDRLSPAESALLLGVTIGGRGRLPAELKMDCIRAGVYHIMVVSGQNVALIISLATAFLRLIRLPPRHTLWVCLPPLVFYTAVVGGDPPVVRAVCMALVGLVVTALGRDVPRFYPLLLAAGGILFVSPEALFGASFQLSFGATASLMTVLPMGEDLPARRWRVLRWLVDTGLICLAVYLGIWPLLVIYFHRLSVVGLAANWTIFPMSAVLMVLGLAVGTIGAWNPAYVPLFATEGIGWLSQLMLRCIGWLARPAWAAVPCRPPGPLAVGMYYVFLFGILFTIHRRKKHAQIRFPLPAYRPPL